MPTIQAFHPSAIRPEHPPRFWRKASYMLVAILVAGLIGARIYLPVWVTGYVNKTLANIPGYTGSIRDVDIHLYRGAYTIHDLKLDKKAGGDLPVPFLNFKSSDLSLQWGALFHGRIVGDVTLYSPTINFATGKSGDTTQTGVETDWTVPIKKLMPLDINYVEIHNGKIAYKDFSTKPEVDLSIYNLEAKVTNLRNVDDKHVALPSTLAATGTSVGKGRLTVNGKLNILKRVPDMDIKGELESVNLVAMNAYAKSFAGIDFHSGNLNLYSELRVQDNKVTGYVKPLLTNLQLIDHTDGPLNVLWESIVSVVMEIFTNQKKDQFATVVPLEGTLDTPETDFWATLGGIIHNAFVKAYSNNIGKD